jgi:hypothetical protein
VPLLTGIDPTAALMRRDAAEHAEALLAERRRAAAAESNAKLERNALARTRRVSRRDEEPEVLDFREPEPEVLRYRRARDARDEREWQSEAASASYPADAGRARYGMELRVAVAEAGSATGKAEAASPGPAAPLPPLVASATPVREAQVALRAYAALATQAGGAGASPSVTSDDYESLRLASLRTHADSAYRAVERPADYARVSVFA